MKPVNIINYVLNLIRMSKNRKNINLIRFLRAICNHKNQGITQNQEILFKIFDVEETQNLIFYPISIQNGIVKVKFPDNRGYTDKKINMIYMSLDELFITNEDEV